MPDGDYPGIIPATPGPRFIRFFAWYGWRLLSRRFHAVRLARENADLLRTLDHHSRPLIVLMSHASWWDPILGVDLGRRFLSRRTICIPMDRRQLERFRFMRRLGMFGLDPDDPSSFRAMVAYVQDWFAAHERPAIWLTPQGEFADPRAPIQLRPGAAGLAAATDDPLVVCLAVEYAFWQDQRPEIFLRAASCNADQPATTAWHRAMTRAMQQNADRLAELVMARDPAAFECLIGGEKAKIHPVYDLILRWRGQRGSIQPRRSPRSSSGAASGQASH